MVVYREESCKILVYIYKDRRPNKAVYRTLTLYEPYSLSSSTWYVLDALLDITSNRLMCRLLAMNDYNPVTLHVDRYGRYKEVLLLTLFPMIHP